MNTSAFVLDHFMSFIKCDLPYLVILMKRVVNSAGFPAHNAFSIPTLAQSWLCVHACTHARALLRVCGHTSGAEIIGSLAVWHDMSVLCLAQCLPIGDVADTFVFCIMPALCEEPFLVHPLLLLSMYPVICCCKTIKFTQGIINPQRWSSLFHFKELALYSCLPSNCSMVSLPQLMVCLCPLVITLSNLLLVQLRPINLLVEVCQIQPFKPVKTR